MKKTLILLLIMVIFFITLLMIRSQIDSTSKNLSLITPEGKTIEISLNKKDFNLTEFETARGDSFSGFSVREIVEKFSKNEFSSLQFASQDGGKIHLPVADLDNIFLVKVKKDDSEYLRLIISTDTFGQRWLKHINSIKLLK